MQIRFFPEADAELAEARLSYALQREGLDVSLMQRIDETLQRINDAPSRFPVVYRQLRRAIVKQFPFAVFYKATENEIVVFHSRRNPKQLKSRLKQIV